MRSSQASVTSKGASAATVGGLLRALPSCLIRIAAFAACAFYDSFSVLLARVALALKNEDYD